MRFAREPEFWFFLLLLAIVGRGLLAYFTTFNHLSRIFTL